MLEKGMLEKGTPAATEKLSTATDRRRERSKRNGDTHQGEVQKGDTRRNGAEMGTPTKAKPIGRPAKRGHPPCEKGTPTMLEKGMLEKGTPAATEKLSTATDCRRERSNPRLPLG